MRIIILLICLLPAIAVYSCGSCHQEQNRKEMKSGMDGNAIQSGKNALDLKPAIDVRSDSLVVFSVEAKRNFINEDEFFPNSENFRVVVFSDKGTELWNSGKDQVYMQVLMPVKPEQPGGSYTYTMEWNGVKDNGARLSPGVYRVVMTLPSRPRPYIAETELRWETK